MEAVIPPQTRALFESALTGELEFLDLLVVSRANTQLFYYLKEVQRMGRGRRFPPLMLFDLMQSQRESVRAYNWSRFIALIERLERLAVITDDALRDAIAATNSVRRAQRRLLDLRWRAAVSGVDAMTALGAGYFMSPTAYATALSAYLDTLDQTILERPRLLVVTSEPLSHTRLHAALEQAGALVVAEDDCWGSRAPGADIALDGSPREAIFQKYWLDTASPGVYPATVRESWLRQHALRPDLHGVVFYLPPSDHQLGWDYPRLNRWLSSNGKPSFLVRVDATTPGGFQTIQQQTQRFLEENA
jgi:benzoyl-CoA reductase/2-hydroxyglutaryl-CoA dehydratase subunit BcrC/BadD/HgdB